MEKGQQRERVGNREGRAESEEWRKGNGKWKNKKMENGK